MPANLTPEYRLAEEKFKRAETIEEKISALEEMLAKIPKHKGTEKLQADIKSKLAKYRKQTEKKATGCARRSESYHIPREGAGRVVLVGEPNTGKSKLFVTLTGTDSDIADYPFTTRKPIPGMIPFEDIKIQLIDLPPINQQYTEGWVFEIIRLADLALLVIDISSIDPAAQVSKPAEFLSGKKVELITQLNNENENSEKLHGEAGSIVKIPAIIVANFIDIDGATDIYSLFKTEINDQSSIVPVSASTGEGIEELKKEIFYRLKVVRVYSKQPGKKPSSEPFVLKRGSTVLDFAGKIHKDFVEKFQYARIWRRGIDNKSEIEGIRVSKDFILSDGDIIELHI